jgi:hypothetical protein
VIHLDPSPLYLTIRVIPRSTKRTVRLEQNTNLTFKLDEIDVGGLDVPNALRNGHEQDTGKVTVRVVELYGYVEQWDPQIVWRNQGSVTWEFDVFRVKKPGGAK